MTSPPAELPGPPGPLPDRPRMVVKTAEDVLAAVNVVLGFEPRNSAVMLTFGGAESFQARVDLPPAAAAGKLDGIAEQLLEPARSHGVRSVAFVLYSRDPVVSHRLARRLTRRFEAAGIGVVQVLRAHDRRWHATIRCGEPAEGVPYDVSSHRFTAQSVLEGRVIHRSREALAALLHARPKAVDAVQRARRRALPLSADRMAPVVLAALKERTFDDGTLAAVLLGLLDVAARDAAWSELDRDTAPHHVELWTDVVRRSPRDLVAAPAALLALASWLAGHGALAWCAVDRCREVEPENSLARLVGDLLAAAVPPSCWDRLWAES